MKRGIIITLVVLAVIGLGYLVSTQLEQVPITRETGFKSEARRNPWLAAEWMIDRLGLACDSIDDLEDLPPTDHTLILRSAGANLSPARSRELLDWAQRGGNLVLLAPSSGSAQLTVPFDRPGGVTYPITEALGFRYVRATNPVDHAYLVGGRPLHATMPDSIRMRDVRGDSETHAGRRSSAWLLVFPRGKGVVTVVAGDAWMTNDLIDERDHARLAWELARGGGDRAGAWLVRDETHPGLLALLARHWIVPVSGFVVLIVWLWRVGARFGPTLPNPERDRRDFSEHVEASGEFLWRAGCSASLLAAPRRELRDRIEARRPDWASLDEESLATALAEQMSWPAERTAELLGETEAKHAARFARIVKDLKEARDSL